jgi:hypothetical protein
MLSLYGENIAALAPVKKQLGSLVQRKLFDFDPVYRAATIINPTSTCNCDATAFKKDIFQEPPPTQSADKKGGHRSTRLSHAKEFGSRPLRFVISPRPED